MNSAAQGAIVIVGCQRSGTTLVRTICEQHRDLLVHPAEPQFILELYQQAGLRLPSARAGSDYIMHHRYRAPLLTPDLLPVADVPVSLADLTAAYLLAWQGGGSDHRRIALKHPALVYHLSLVDAVLPGATILHVVRDPRAAVASQRARWPHFSVWHGAMLWKEAVRSARKWQADHPARFVEVQYEALVQEPVVAVQAACEALSLPYYDDLLTFEQREVVYDRGQAREREFRGPESSRMDRWRTLLSPEDIRLVERGCREEMRWWDYALLAPETPAGPLLARRLRESAAYGGRVAARQVKRVLRLGRSRLRRSR